CAAVDSRVRRGGRPVWVTKFHSLTSAFCFAESFGGRCKACLVVRRSRRNLRLNGGSLGSVEETIRYAGGILQRGAAEVKLAGGAKRIDMVRVLVDCEIPVMGHLGLPARGRFQLSEWLDRKSLIFSSKASATQSQAGRLVTPCITRMIEEGSANWSGVGK